MRRSQFLILLIALGWGSQPSAAAGAPPAEVARQGADEAITLLVVNNNWQDMRVFAVIDSRRIRLGTVTSMTTQTLESGDSLEFRIANSIGLSLLRRS